MIEVLISPIVESLPGDKKAASMSLLHSFYCWGQMAVVLPVHRLFYHDWTCIAWQWLTALWALVPLFNMFFFLKVPAVRAWWRMGRACASRRSSPAARSGCCCCSWFARVLRSRRWPSGPACSRKWAWASLKTTGDLLGPCAFAILMGSARVFFGSRGSHLPLTQDPDWLGRRCAWSAISWRCSRRCQSCR